MKSFLLLCEDNLSAKSYLLLIFPYICGSRCSISKFLLSQSFEELVDAEFLMKVSVIGCTLKKKLVFLVEDFEECLRVSMYVFL